MIAFMLYLGLMTMTTIWPLVVLRHRLSACWYWLGNSQDGTKPGLSSRQYDQVRRDIVAPVIFWAILIPVALLAQNRAPDSRGFIVVLVNLAFAALMLDPKGQPDYSWLRSHARPSREMFWLVRFHDRVVRILRHRIAHS